MFRPGLKTDTTFGSEVKVGKKHIGLNDIKQKSIFIKLEGILASSVVL